MTAATLTLSASERDTLHGLMLHRLFVPAENLTGLARTEGVTVEELCERLGGDLRLMEELGWLFESDPETVELTCRRGAGRTLKRLRRDARRAPLSKTPRAGARGER